MLKVYTKGDVSNVVSHRSICVLQLQRRLSVAEQHLRSCVTCTPALLKLLQGNISTHVLAKQYLYMRLSYTKEEMLSFFFFVESLRLWVSNWNVEYNQEINCKCSSHVLSHFPFSVCAPAQGYDVFSPLKSAKLVVSSSTVSILQYIKLSHFYLILFTVQYFTVLAMETERQFSGITLIQE